MAATEDDDAHLLIDEAVAAHLIGPMVPHNAPITLADYDPAWPALFAREADRIRAILGSTAS